MSAIDTAPGLAADVARIKRIEQLERDIAESNEYARKLGLKVTDLGNDIQKFKAERDALQARVKRLEDAGDNLARRLKLWKMEDGWLCSGDEEAFKDWQETKETKP